MKIYFRNCAKKLLRTKNVDLPFRNSLIKKPIIKPFSARKL